MATAFGVLAMTDDSNLSHRRIGYSLGGVLLLALVCLVAPQAMETSTAAMSVPGTPAADAAEPDVTASTMAAARTTAARPEGSFLTAELPGKVEHTTDVRKTVVGDIEQATDRSEAGDAALSITASVLPGIVTALTPEDLLYRKARNELLKTFSAESTSWESCTHAGFACRKLRYAADDGRKGMARLYLHEGVLVVINAIFVDDEAIARRFLASAH